MNSIELKTLLGCRRDEKKRAEWDEIRLGMWDHSFMRDYGAVLLRTHEEDSYGRMIDSIEERFTGIYRILLEEKFHCRDKFLKELRELFETMEREAILAARIFHRIAELDVEAYVHMWGRVPDTIEILIDTVYPNADRYAGFEVASAYYGYLTEQIYRMHSELDALSEKRSELYRAISGILEILEGEEDEAVCMLDEVYERFIAAIGKGSESIYEEGVYSTVRLYRMSAGCTA